MTKLDRSVKLSQPPFGLMAFRSEGIWKTILGEMARSNPVTYQTHLCDSENAIAKYLWPRWDFQRKTWKDDPSNKLASALVDVELVLISNLQRQLNEPAFRNDGTLNDALFLIEDGWIGTGGGASRSNALGALGSYKVLKQNKEFAYHLGTMTVGGALLIENFIMYLKGQFRRSRPAHAALMAGKSLTIQYAQTSITPAIVSGHALQAIMRVTNAYLQSRDYLSKGEVEDAKAFAVGAGDRRVYAGVHFPSDSFGSWIAAAHLADYYWPNDAKDARKFIYEAIENNSPVYQATIKEKVFDDVRKYLKQICSCNNGMH
jgi:PAP2 superfamily